MEEVADLFIIGGGINGVGIARDASGRGLNVTLCEKNDLAYGTSSSSTKLIHGGLRYLEQYEFRLVRESLIEREVLLRSAPHIINPMRFVLPHHSDLRPAWFLRLGLFIYDHLGGRKILPSSRVIDFAKEDFGKPLKDSYRKGFEYYDCWVDDARLVVLNAMDARARGANVLVRTDFQSAETVDGIWQVKIRQVDGIERVCHARILINATGPWLTDTLHNINTADIKHSLKLVKGSHIIVRKIFAGEHAYIFQHTDDRVVFAIPYQEDYTLIGTTDVIYTGDPGEVVINDNEITYLCGAVNEYFKQSIGKDDIVWHYSGVRPLFEDGSQNASTITRDYVFDLSAPEHGAPLLSIYGGKLTTYRKLAEHALDKLAPYLPASNSAWTKTEVLPGGDISNADFADYCQLISKRYAWLPGEYLRRMLIAYGTRLEQILAKAESVSGLGIDFGHGLYESELRYLIENEWVSCADDVLWRRSKLGIVFSQNEIEYLQSWIELNK